jgi:hypothetical protein
MLALPAITIPPNPAPAVISNEMWRFRTYCLWLEPGSQDVDSGIFADKPGYHNKRNALPSTDYSVRLQADKEGPSDKASAFDWTFRTAQGGNYSRIIFYSDRIEAAFNRRDPRLYGFREVLCQADTDLAAEGFDFVSWTRRTPDDSHLWHMHFSKLRKYINDRQSYDAMLSILSGQSLADWEEDMPTAQEIAAAVWNYKISSPALNRSNIAAGDWIKSGYGAEIALRSMSTVLDTVASKVDLDPAELEAIKTAAREGATAATALIIDGVLAGLPSGDTVSKEEVKQALTEWFTPAVEG